MLCASASLALVTASRNRRPCSFTAASVKKRATTSSLARSGEAAPTSAKREPTDERENGGAKRPGERRDSVTDAEQSEADRRHPVETAAPQWQQLSAQCGCAEIRSPLPFNSLRILSDEGLSRPSPVAWATA